jgi:hypothetical protein
MRKKYFNGQIFFEQFQKWTCRVSFPSSRFSSKLKSEKLKKTKQNDIVPLWKRGSDISIARLLPLQVFRPVSLQFKTFSVNFILSIGFDLNSRSEYGVTKCFHAGGIYMFTQLCKMLILTFFPETVSADATGFNFLGVSEFNLGDCNVYPFALPGMPQVLS